MTALCVGLTTLDVVHHVDGAPAWGGKHRAVGGELLAGGPAANAAVTAAALLGSARLLTALGRTGPADPVRADLAEHRVTLLDVAPPDWPTPVASVVVDLRTGDRTVVGAAPAAVPDGRAVSAAGPDGTPGPPADPLHGVAAVLLDGHHAGLAAAVAERAAAAGLPVLLDAGSWKPEVVEWLPAVTVAACSADLCPPGGRRAGDDPRAAADLLHRLGVPTVLVTDGARPVFWSVAVGGTGTVPVPRAVAVDTLGAGDAFHGALVAASASGVTGLVEAVEFAAGVAALRCTHLGGRAWLHDPALRTHAHRLRSDSP
ncbi:MAG: PfkB family carbohydrate kinase [Pseudonocardia sp.]